MSSTYTFPKVGTQEAILLAKLLNGEIIRNHRTMTLINSPSPSSVMSHLRTKRNWDTYIQRKSCSSTSSTGHPTRVVEYSMKDILDLKTNDPKIEKFLKSNSKYMS